MDDMTGWAKRPRSQKALDFVIELAGKKEREFMDILAKLKKDGRTDGVLLLQRWDHVTGSWTR